MLKQVSESIARLSIISLLISCCLSNSFSQIYISSQQEHDDFIIKFGDERIVEERVIYLNMPDSKLRFYKWNFKNGVETIGINNIVFKDCIFKKYTSFNGERIELQNNTFSQALLVEGSESIILKQNQIYSDSSECIINSDTSVLAYKVFVSIISDATAVTEVKNNIFESLASPGRIYFSGESNELTVVDNVISGDLEMDGGKVNDRFRFYGNTIEGNLGFNDFLFAEFFNEIEWSQIEGFKLCLFTAHNSFEEKCWIADQSTSLVETKPRIYKAYSSYELGEKRTFRKLVRSYAQLYDHYKNEGDLISANGVFSELKDLEGRRLAHQFRSNYSFNNYFKYVLNRILKFYTNHGTNPALALVRSLYIILVFMVMFIFFPSDWDEHSIQRIRTGFSNIETNNFKAFFKSIFSFIISVSLSLLNAFTLSLNSFITLGFGNIPTQGVARFLCVLEGIIGWFLLSIFIVALINQVIW